MGEGEEAQYPALDGELLYRPVEGDDQHRDRGQAEREDRVDDGERLVRVKIRAVAKVVPRALELDQRPEPALADQRASALQRLLPKVGEDGRDRIVERGDLLREERQDVVERPAQDGEEGNVEQQQPLAPAQADPAQTIDQRLDDRSEEDAHAEQEQDRANLPYEPCRDHDTDDQDRSGRDSDEVRLRRQRSAASWAPDPGSPRHGAGTRGRKRPIRTVC